MSIFAIFNDSNYREQLIDIRRLQLYELRDGNQVRTVVVVSVKPNDLKQPIGIEFLIPNKISSVEDATTRFEAKKQLGASIIQPRLRIEDIQRNLSSVKLDLTPADETTKRIYSAFEYSYILPHSKRPRKTVNLQKAELGIYSIEPEALIDIRSRIRDLLAIYELYVWIAILDSSGIVVVDPPSLDVPRKDALDNLQRWFTQDVKDDIAFACWRANNVSRHKSFEVTLIVSEQADQISQQVNQVDAMTSGRGRKRSLSGPKFNEKDIQSAVDDLHSKIKALTDREDKLTQTVTNHQLALEEMKSTIEVTAQINNSQSEIFIAIKTLDHKYERLRQDLTQLLSDIRGISNDLSRLEEHTKVLPIFDQTLLDQILAPIQTDIGRLTTETMHLQQRMITISSQTLSDRKVYLEIKTALQEFRDRLSRLEDWRGRRKWCGYMPP